MKYMRKETFKPYMPGLGPEFRLILLDSRPNWKRPGSELVSYELWMDDTDGSSVLLFKGEDFSPSPILNDDAVRSLMTFLCLQPGDTDAEYFSGYSDEQMEFAEQHGEHLALCVEEMFGEDWED